MTGCRNSHLVMTRGHHRSALVVLLTVGLLGPPHLLAISYGEARTAAVTRCRAIDPSAYQSGLAFNPDGLRSYYVRSQCFQEAAVLFRDASLCAEVTQRKTVLFSSWGYAPGRCRDLVGAGMAADRRELEAMKRLYAAGPMHLRDFRVERNGNGRDIDIIPEVAGTYAHGYVLSFELLRAGRPPILLHSSGYYLDPSSNLRIYLPQADIRRRFPDYTPAAYSVRATVTLDVGMGGPAGYWSDAFIDQVFAVRERSQSITKDVRF